MILLIAPHSESVYGELNPFSAIEPPIWEGLLHNALNLSGYPASLLDQHAEHFSHAETVKTIKRINPHLIVLVVYGHQPSASSQTMQAAHELLDEMQKNELTLPVLLVGGHPSAVPVDVLRKETYSNLMVAKGEGLNAIKAFCEGRGEQIPGVYRRGKTDSLIVSPWQSDKKAENLDQTFPGIDWKSLPLKKYRAHNWHVLEHPETINSYAAIYTSLGCPFRCSFCCINAPFDSSSFRYWTPHFTVWQIEVLWELGIRNLKIADEMFVLKEAHFMEICRILIRNNKNRSRKVKMNIWAYARVDTVKSTFLQTMKTAGINWLALGIESGSQYVRNGVTKGRFKIDDIHDTVKRIKSHGIHVIGNYIFGLPDDTEESMKETLDMALDLNCEFANFYSAMAYPGSELYLRTPKEDLPDTYLGYSQHAYETKPLRTKTLTAREVLKFRDEAHKAYFTNPGYLSLIEKKFGKPGLTLIEEMNKRTIRRKLYDGSEVPAS